MILRERNTVLFIGDSITHAHRRAEEQHDCYSMGCGYVNIVAGTINADYPQLRPRFVNSGVCGDTIEHLAARWERDCLEQSPDAISILVGINDSNPSLRQSPRAFAKTYRHILQLTRNRLPHSRLIILEPFALGTPDVSIECFENLKVRQSLVGEIAAEFGSLFVPLQTAFDHAPLQAPPSHWALDGIHPSAAGHQLIARSWLKAVGA